MGVACRFWKTSSLSSTRKCLQFLHIMKREANTGEESLAEGDEVSHLWLCYQSAEELAWVLGPEGSHQCSSFSSQLGLMDFNHNFQLERSGWLYPCILLYFWGCWLLGRAEGRVVLMQTLGVSSFGGLQFLFLLRGVLCDPWLNVATETHLTRISTHQHL